MNRSNRPLARLDPPTADVTATLEQTLVALVLAAAGAIGIAIGALAPRMHALELVFGALFVLLGLATLAKARGR